MGKVSDFIISYGLIIIMSVCAALLCVSLVTLIACACSLPGWRVPAIIGACGCFPVIIVLINAIIGEFKHKNV